MGEGRRGGRRRRKCCFVCEIQGWQRGYHIKLKWEHNLGLNEKTKSRLVQETDIEDCRSLVGVWGGYRWVMEISRGKGKDIQEKVLGEDIMGLIDWEDLGIIDTRTSRSTAVRTTTRLGQWVLRGRQEWPEAVTKNAESGETGTA